MSPATAQNYFAALYTNKDASIAPITATYTANNGNLGNTIQLSANGSINTDFMKVLGSNFGTMGFGTTSTTAWGNVKMRVALALDNTGSMSSDGKITALRNAVAGTGGLIDQLSALAKNNGDVYISVIPFAKVVNAGASNYSASWIDWTDWLNPPTAQPANAVSGTTNYEAMLPVNWHALGPGTKCPFTNSNSGFTCTSGPDQRQLQTFRRFRRAAPTPATSARASTTNSHTLYNGCWDSELVNDATPQPECSARDSSCSCPVTASGSAVNGCSCSGSGSSRSCTGLAYIHNWTQPGPNDTTHNSNQPQVSAQVGFNIAATTVCAYPQSSKPSRK